MNKDELNKSHTQTTEAKEVKSKILSRIQHQLNHKEGEEAMTFNISAVAACCSRASFRSLLGPDSERRLARVAVGAMRRLFLVVLRPFAGLALLVFALPPVFDGRAISAPNGQ